MNNKNNTKCVFPKTFEKQHLLEKDTLDFEKVVILGNTFEDRQISLKTSGIFGKMETIKKKKIYKIQFFEKRFVKCTVIRFRVKYTKL